jgi:hypothetical protein
MPKRLLALSFLAGSLSLGCGAAPPAAEPAEAGAAGFWASLQSLCGHAFEGRLAQGNETDSAFSNSRLVMHVRECNESEIRIPFHVGEDRSRTWVLTRTETGLRLKHDHRHEDGSPEEVTQYGGDTAQPGTPEWQEFPADAHTAALIPAAATNVWTIEVIPDTTFAYALRREGTDRRFRVEFDLARPVEAPPAPWGN